MAASAGGCPKCGSQSYTPPSCLICGFTAWVHADGDFRTASEHRLGAVFAERDLILDAEGEEPMPDQAKVYRCTQCEQSFPTSQGLAGHLGGHKRRAEAAPPERAVSARGGPKPKKPHGAAPPANGGGLLCPTCAQPLPDVVGVVADDFAAEGIDAELAAKLAVRAFGLFRVS